MATNYPGALDTDATVGGGSIPASSDALDYSTGQPTHSGLHQNVGDAIEQIQTKLGTGVSSPAANKALVSNGTASEWGQIASAMIADGAVGNDQLVDDPTFTDISATSLTATGTVTGDLVSATSGLSSGGGVLVADGTAASPSFHFTSDTNTGVYLSAADEISFSTNGTQRLKINSSGTLIWINSSGLGGPLNDTSSTSGYRYILQNQTYGTFFDYTSIRARKEQITNVTAADSGAWIDALQPVTFIERWMGEGDEPADNRTYREADKQVGFIADDVLSNSDTSLFAQATDNGEGGLDPAGWKWECVIAAAVAELKSVRARLAALEG